MNLAANLTATAARDGARTALVLGDERLSYLELEARAADQPSGIPQAT